MTEDDFEIKDEDDYTGFGKKEVFSHSQLVMISMKKCIEAGTKEMREGYVNEKADRYGNIVRTQIPDTRKELIESVKTLMMIMASDIDDEAKKKIGKIRYRLNKSYNKFCKYEEDEWKEAHITIKNHWNKEGTFFRKGMLSKGLPYAVEYIMEQVDSSRKIFAQLTRLTKRLDWYREEDFAA